MHLVLTRPPGLPTPFTKPSSRPKEAAGWLARSPRSPPHGWPRRRAPFRRAPNPVEEGGREGEGERRESQPGPVAPAAEAFQQQPQNCHLPFRPTAPGPVGASVKDLQEGGVSPLDAQGTGQKASGTADREGPVSVGGEAPRRRSAPRGAAVRMKRGTGVLRGALCSCSLPLPRGLHTRQRAPVASATRA